MQVIELAKYVLSNSIDDIITKCKDIIETNNEPKSTIADNWQYTKDGHWPNEPDKNYYLWFGKDIYVTAHCDGIRLWKISENPEEGWYDIQDVIAWQEITLPKVD